ncbi:MAG: DUF4190 domain-containing protein [Streptosporangiales bacterium]|nr:DUF4190 domain-containing protein [Streptosporangiales bacterium]
MDQVTQQPGWSNPQGDPGGASPQWYDQPPADQPGYGQQQYGQQQYGEVQQYGQGYGPQQPMYVYPPSRPTNMMAILALVFCFVFAPVGLILGIIARKQIRETGEEGNGLALAGIIVGAIFTGLIVLYILFYVVLFGILFATTGV